MNIRHQRNLNCNRIPNSLSQNPKQKLKRMQCPPTSKMLCDDFGRIFFHYLCFVGRLVFFSLYQFVLQLEIIISIISMYVFASFGDTFRILSDRIFLNCLLFSIFFSCLRLSMFHNNFSRFVYIYVCFFFLSLVLTLCTV